jgi:(4S)-4-hydroxy-5-phosphonooxypentane-2,3-dione isomerase
MFATIVQIHVKPGHLEDFIRAVRENRERSIVEPGNVRFDILQSAEDPARFITYMAWRDESGLEAHRHTPHYCEFRDLVADWMAEPRRNEPYLGLFEPE